MSSTLWLTSTNIIHYIVCFNSLVFYIWILLFVSELPSNAEVCCPKIYFLVFNCWLDVLVANPFHIISLDESLGSNYYASIILTWIQLISKIFGLFLQLWKFIAWHGCRSWSTGFLLWLFRVFTILKHVSRSNSVVNQPPLPVVQIIFCFVGSWRKQCYIYDKT